MDGSKINKNSLRAKFKASTRDLNNTEKYELWCESKAKDLREIFTEIFGITTVVKMQKGDIHFSFLTIEGRWKGLIIKLNEIILNYQIIEQETLYTANFTGYHMRYTDEKDLEIKLGLLRILI